MEGEG